MRHVSTRTLISFNCFFFIVTLSHQIAQSFPLSQSLFRQETTCPVILQSDHPSRFLVAAETAPNLAQLTVANNTPRRNYFSSSNNTAPRIVNGNFVSSPRLTQMAAFLFDSRRASVCSGTLVSPSWVLTAAHCQLNERSTQVIIGAPAVTVRATSLTDIELQFDEDLGTLFSVRRVIRHPNSLLNELSLVQNDIALVQLSQPSSGTNFMALNANRGEELPEKSFSRLMGYGITEPSEQPARFFLRQVDVPIFPTDRCREKARIAFSQSNHVCAGYRTRECGACLGDSGGPLLQYDTEGNPVQIGISSFGVSMDCGQPDEPVVTIRIDTFISWIGEQDVPFTAGGELQVVFHEGLDDVSPNVGAIVGGVAGSIFLILILLGVFLVWQRKNPQRVSASEVPIDLVPTTADEQAIPVKTMEKADATNGSNPWGTRDGSVPQAESPAVQDSIPRDASPVVPTTVNEPASAIGSTVW